MRTVAFSDESVIELVNQRFVAAWKNIRPSTRFQDGLYIGKPRGERLAQGLPRGTGEDNICAFVAGADGRILHAIQGYHNAADFLGELEFALRAAEALAREGEKALPALYGKRSAEIEADKVLRANLKLLGSKPLPALEKILKADAAGLR